MSINYIEKGPGLHEFIRTAGHWLAQRDNVWYSSNDSVVQNLIDVYDELPEYKKERITKIKLDGLVRIQAVFPAIQTLDDLEFFQELWDSLAPAAKRPTPKLISIFAIYSAGKSAIQSVAAAKSKAEVDAVTVAWP